MLPMAAIGVAINLGAAFAAGLPLAYCFKRRWLRLSRERPALAYTFGI